MAGADQEGNSIFYGLDTEYFLRFITTDVNEYKPSIFAPFIIISMRRFIV